MDGGYSTREVSTLLGLPLEEVRSYAQVLKTGRGPKGEYRFSFQDLVVLRSAKGLTRDVPARKVRSSLGKVREQLGADRPLATVRLAVAGSQVVVKDDEGIWDADSGQALFDFGPPEPEPARTSTAPEDDDLSPPPPVLRPSRPFGTKAVTPEAADSPADVEEWFQLGCEVEASDVEKAREAYREALRLDPRHVSANLNMGRLYHQERNLPVAELHYRRAAEADPSSVTAVFNLGVVLEDLGKREQAVKQYERAVELDPSLANAHYNLALLHERAGRKAAAIRHFKAYKKLTPGE